METADRWARSPKPRALLAVVLGASLVGCADLSPLPAADASVDSAVLCNEGQMYCAPGSHQRCEGGQLVEVQACGADQICTLDRGCLDCDPAVGKGCRNNAIHTCEANATIGGELESCLGLACENGECVHPRCAVGAQDVYVVDIENRLLRFRPSKEMDHFTLVATLRCPTKGTPLPSGQTVPTPFSMSVDRSARAWVLYTSGELFWVDTETGECTPSPFERGQQGFELFGMGFVSDKAGSDRERLYVVTEQNYSAAPNRLGYIEPATLELIPVGQIDAAGAELTPELTGSGNAELFAYFPGQASTFVARLSKDDATLDERWPVTGVAGSVRSWAFAHWGGKFYIFVTADEVGGQKSRVLKLDPATGVASTFLPTIPYRIVGAGVSTCAPTID